MNRLTITVLAGIALAVASSSTALAANRQLHRKPGYPVATHADRVAARHAETMPWHGPYAHTWWGGPVPLVVPPTAQMQTNWAWGVSQSTMTPIYHQFRRPYPGGGGGGEFGCTPTPVWPSDTRQFGVYYVRGPWGSY